MAARESSGPPPSGYEHRSIGDIQDQAQLCSREFATRLANSAAEASRGRVQNSPVEQGQVIKPFFLLIAKINV